MHSMSIFKQAKNTSLLWRSDRAGQGIAIDGSKRGVARCADRGFGVQLAEHWVTQDVCRVTLALEEISGECEIGVVGRNFNPSNWSAPLHDNGHAVVLNAKTGRIVHKGRETSFVLRKGLQSGCVVAISADLGARTLTFERLAADGTAEATVACDNIPAEIAIAVGFGPGSHRAVILEGISHKPDSCPQIRSTKDLWDGARRPVACRWRERGCVCHRVRCLRGLRLSRRVRAQRTTCRSSRSKKKTTNGSGRQSRRTQRWPLPWPSHATAQPRTRCALLADGGGGEHGRWRERVNAK